MLSSIVVRQNSQLGRYATVSDNVRAGDLLFDEQPYVIGPKPQSAVICLGCCCPIDGSAGGPRCSMCGWPLCSDSCAFRELHRRECDLFVINNVRFIEQGPIEFCMQLDCITPLRWVFVWFKYILIFRYYYYITYYVFWGVIFWVCLSNFKVFIFHQITSWKTRRSRSLFAGNRTDGMSHRDASSTRYMESRPSEHCWILTRTVWAAKLFFCRSYSAGMWISWG